MRALVLALGIIFAAAGAALCLLHRTCPPGIQLLFIGAVVIAGVVFERWRYRNKESRPAANSAWQQTGERFVDPESGRTMEVFYDPATGDRRYVDSAD